MRTVELAKEAIQNGVIPVVTEYYPVCSFDDELLALRSVLTLRSLEVGTITAERYRFLARRSKDLSERLFSRHLEKVLDELPAILSGNRNISCVTLPVYPRLVREGKLTEILFNSFATRGGIETGKLCLEISSDILFEESAGISEEISAAKELGVKIALSEACDSICPLGRLAAFGADLVFADSLLPAAFSEEVTENTLKFLQLSGLTVYAPALGDAERISAAQQLGFEGYTVPTPLVKEVSL